MAIVDLHIPISEEAIRALHVGDQVRLYGVMVTARDAAPQVHHGHLHQAAGHPGGRAGDCTTSCKRLWPAA